MLEALVVSIVLFPAPCRPYATLHTAVVAALTEALPLQNFFHWEYGGFVYEKFGSICYTKPSTSESSHSLYMMVHVDPEAKILANYHTHPGTELAANIFSATDVQNACKHGGPSYLTTEDGRMYMIDSFPHLCIPPFIKRPGKFIGFAPSPRTK